MLTLIIFCVDITTFIIYKGGTTEILGDSDMKINNQTPNATGGPDQRAAFERHADLFGDKKNNTVKATGNPEPRLAFGRYADFIGDKNRDTSENEYDAISLTCDNTANIAD